LSGWRQAALLTVTFAGMLATAKIFSKSEAKHERERKALPAGPATGGAVGAAAAAVVMSS
jgi:hypothetical protein